MFSIGSILIYASDFEEVQEDIILSPDSRELADYEDYCRRELPRRVREALEEIVHNESQPMEESIRNQLMNIIRDCQDRVFSSYRSSAAVAAAVAAVDTPSSNPIASESPIMASQESMAMVTMSSGATPERSFGRTAPPFFQPPPPQVHLRSGLEVSDLQGSITTKAPDGSDPSDSGYSSNESSVPSGISSSFNNTSDSSSLPNSEPHIEFSGPVPANAQGTWDMGNGFDINTGNDVFDSHDTSTFNQSWLNNSSQSEEGNVWHPYMGNLGMEYLFSSDQAL